MDEADIYYVDARNAEPIVIGRTTGGGRPVLAPGTRVIRPTAVPGSRAYVAHPYGNNPYGSPYAMPQQSGLGSSLFGGMSGGQLVDLVAQIFAALMPLPAAPVSTADVGTDVGNLMLYQGSLAQYAKRDEQVRTLGNLVTKLLG